MREGILTSEAVNSLTPGAELFFRRLMSVADDYGRYYSHPSILRANCFPLKLDMVGEADVKQWLIECETAGLITIYGEKKAHIQIHKFNQQTRSKSKFPDPDNQTLSKCLSSVKQMRSLDGDGNGVGDVIGNGGGTAVPLANQISKEKERDSDRAELNRIIKRLDALGTGETFPKGSPKHGEILELRGKRTLLKSKWGWSA